MFCPNCGKEIEEGSKFCASCGYKIGSQDNNIMTDKVNSVDVKNKVSKNIDHKSKHKSKLPIFLIMLIVIIALAFGATYFVTKDNPINVFLKKIDEIKFNVGNNQIARGSNFDDKINQIKSVAINGNIQNIKGFSIDDFDTVIFGSYPQDDKTGGSKESIEWIVLDKVGDKALLMSKKVLDKKPFCNTNRHSNWEESDLRNWLNNDFYNQAFSDKEKESMLTESIKNSRLSLQQFPELNDKSNISKVSDGNLYNKNGDDTSHTLYWYSKIDSVTYTNDNVFIPSYEELNKYFGVEGFDGDGITEWWQADYMIQNIYCDLINNKLTENEYISQVKNILKSYSMDDYNESLFDEYEKLKYLYLDNYSWANRTKVLRAKGTPYSDLSFKAIGRDFLLLNNETGGVPYWLRVESEYSIIDYESNTKANTNLVIDGEGKAYTYYDNIPTKVESNEIGVRPCIWVSFNNTSNDDGQWVYPVNYSEYDEVLKKLRDENSLIAHNEIIDASQGEYLGYQIVDIDKNGVDELVLFRGYIDGNPYIYDIWTIKYGRMTKLSIDGFTYDFKTNYGKEYKDVYYVLNNDDILLVSKSSMDDVPSYTILGKNNNKFSVKQKFLYSDYNNNWSVCDENNNYHEVGKTEGDNLINDYLSKVSFFNADLRNGLIESNTNSILGDNVHIEGADVYQNSDGSIQIGGISNEGAKLVQSGDNNAVNNELEYDYSKPPIYSEDQVALDNSDIKDAKANKYKDNLSTQIKKAKLVTEYPADTIIDQMDTVTFGSYPQSDASGKTNDPIEWIVLERQGDKAFLLSKYIVENAIYDNSLDASYENSYIRNYLNNELLEKCFNDSEKSLIMNIDIGLSSDKITILNYNEAIKYFGSNINGNKKSATRITNYLKLNKSDITVANNASTWYYGNSSYWLRDVDNGKAAYIGLSGNINKDGDDVKINDGIRPMICVLNNDKTVESESVSAKGNDSFTTNGYNSNKLRKDFIDEYNSEENKGKCKFDSEGNLWIESWPYLGSGPGEGVTIKYANGNEEHYEYSGFASAYSGGGHIDIYATEVNGVKRDIEVRNENIKDSDKEFVNKIYEMIEKFKGLKNEYNN